MSDVDIPTEAYEAAGRAFSDAVWNDKGELEPSDCFDRALDAAVPHIARVAQVQILREVAAKIRRSKWTSQSDTLAVVARGTALQIAQTIEARADELGDTP